MTPKQRLAHINAIHTLLTSIGYKQDRWENYKAISNGKTYRIKIMSNNLRAELKIGDSWAKLFSTPLVKVSLEKLTLWLSTHLPDQKA